MNEMEELQVRMMIRDREDERQRKDGYNMAMVDFFEALDICLTPDNIEAVKAIREHMEHAEEIRKRTGFKIGSH